MDSVTLVTIEFDWLSFCNALVMCLGTGVVGGWAVAWGLDMVFVSLSWFQKAK